VSPNAISVSSVIFALLACLCFVGTARADPVQARVLFLVAAFWMQLRLLANLLDGMVAIEWNRSSVFGELYNEVPDRIADALILIGAGYAVGGLPELGYGATILAVFVAYVRAVGNHVGAQQLFLGPMAKPHRMAMMTAAALYCAVAPAGWPGAIASQQDVGAIGMALIVISLGGIVTAVRRLRSIASQLGAAR
jgi:phosphatidylglycerophosphate synthase